MGKACVAVVGCGTIGTGVVEMLTKNADRVRLACGAELTLKYIVDLRGGTPPAGVSWIGDVDIALRDPEVRIVVEAIGGAGAAYKISKAALEAGKSVVTPNKELVAKHGSELTDLARSMGVSYLYEASVGGGIPVMRPLKTCLAGNRILSIDGIVNGTTNYILTSMDVRKASFSAALGEAQTKGFAEPDPRADIEGTDVRRKVQVLAHAALGAATGEDERVPTEGIARVHLRDMLLAERLGGTIKLLAHLEPMGDGWTGWVHPAFLPNTNGMAHIQNEICALTITGDCVGDVLLAGRGAGALPTASSIVGDLIEIARGGFATVNHENFDRVIHFVAPDALAQRYLIRCESEVDEAILGDIAQARAFSDVTAILTAPITPGTLATLCEKLATAGATIGIPIKFRQ